MQHLRIEIYACILHIILTCWLTTVMAHFPYIKSNLPIYGFWHDTQTLLHKPKKHLKRGYSEIM